jgi:hypothetical protein
MSIGEIFLFIVGIWLSALASAVYGPDIRAAYIKKDGKAFSQAVIKLLAFILITGIIAAIVAIRM